MKKNSIFKIALIALAMLWSVFVLVGYFAQVNVKDSNAKGLLRVKSFELTMRPSHSYYLAAIKTGTVIKNTQTGRVQISPAIYVMLFFLCLYLLYYFDQSHQGKKVLSINAPPVIFFILFSLIFFANYYAMVGYYRMGSGVSFLLFFKNYFLCALGAIAITALVISVGKRIYDLVHIKHRDNFPDLFFFSFGLGAIAITALIFFLGIFGQINFKSLLISFIVLTVLCFKNIIFWLKKTFIEKIRFKTSFFDPKVLLLSVALIFICYNFMNIARPIPNGHDELESYMNASNILVSSGKLVSGIAYPWQLFIASILAVSKSLFFATFYSSLSGILVACVIYQIVAMFCKRRNITAGYYPLLASVLFFTLPAVVFQLSQDVKMDLPAMFFAGLALICFWQWQDDIKSRHKLFLAALFAGFAFLIKATLIFFAISLFLYLILTLFRLKISFKKSIIIIVLCASVFLLPSVPFGIKNSIELMNAPKEVITPPSFFYGYSSKTIITLDKREREIEKNNLEIIKSNGDAELNRYQDNKSGILKYIFVPVLATFNSAVSGHYVDIGFIFLLFIPLVAIVYPLTSLKKDTSRFFLNEVVIIGSLYWLLWATFSKGIIWYGFPGLIFLLLVLVELLHRIRNLKTKFFYLLTVVVLIFWFSINFLQRTSPTSGQNSPTGYNNLAYAGGRLNGSEYYDVMVPRFSGILSFLNDKIDADKENPPKIYLIGKFMTFFIHENNKTVYADQALETYMAISKGRTGAEVIDRLKKDNMSYILIGRGDISFFGESAELLGTSLNEFVTNIKNNPDKAKVLYNDEGTGIFFAKIL